jgi:hypothetical protein
MKSKISLTIFLIGFSASIWAVPKTETGTVISMILIAASMFMLFAFWMAINYRQEKPKIKSGRVYTIEKVISHNYRDHTAVLNHDHNNIELFRCRFVNNLELLRLDKKYTVQEIDGDLFFTPA